MHSHVFTRPQLLTRIRREMHLRPSPFFSPSDLEMPIQILRVIFVAIKCYIFGLMAQKYSILSTRRASSSGIKTNFRGLWGEKGKKNRGLYEWDRGRRRVSLWHLREYNRHFHDSSDSHRRSEKKRDGAPLLRGSSNEKVSREYDLRAGSGLFATYRSKLFLTPLLLFLSSGFLVCVQSKNPRSLVLVIQSRAYLEIIEGFLIYCPWSSRGPETSLYWLLTI